jgi:acetyltransferase-like isoleucine patch superfamily enzyme
MQINGTGNAVNHGANIAVSGSVTGNNNLIAIGNASAGSAVRITINGDNNTITIGDCYGVKELSIHCGNHVPANGTSVAIGRGFSIEPGGVFLLYNSQNVLSIGDDCLFSSNITIRGGESPHLIFDLQSGEYLDVSDGVFIGNHVWVGERVYVTKRVTVPDQCIIAACAVVTKRFTESNTVLGGNPARVVKKNVHWVRNSDFIETNSTFEGGYRDYQNRSPARMTELSISASHEASGPTLRSSRGE